MKYREKIDAAIKAIDDVFSDTSVKPEETHDAMGELYEHIDMKLAAIESDIFDEDE